MPVGDVGDETMIAGTIVAAAEAMALSTSTPKTKVRLVGRMSSRICRAIVVVLILTVRIVNVWYPHARIVKNTRTNSEATEQLPLSIALHQT